MAKPPTCAELDANAQLMDQRLVSVELMATKTDDKANTTQREHDVRIAKLETENAMLKATHERLEARLWAMLFTTFFAVCTALSSVYLALIKPK